MTDRSTGHTGDGGGRWLIDGDNVVGSRPDGWWRDRTGARVRLAGEVARLAETTGNRVVLVFDGRSPGRALDTAGGVVAIRFAGSGRADAADDEIVALAGPGDTVVTADRRLIERLPDGVDVAGPTALLAALADGGSPPRSD